MLRPNHTIVLAISALIIMVVITRRPHDQVYVYLNNQRYSLKGTVSDSVNEMYSSWKKCMVNKTKSFRGNYTETWRLMGKAVEECEQPYITLLNVEDFSNSDEIKRHIMPLKKGNHEVIVTMGIGHDTSAEEKYFKRAGNGSVDFFGADPMVEINEKLYSKFGKFFPFAVSAKTGKAVASVLDGNSYRNKGVVKLNAIYFLTELIGLKHYDDIWMDCEGAEYELFSFILKGGEFDQNGITICQINVEIHSPDLEHKKMIHDFLFQMLDDERYAFFRPVQSYHMRLFFVNFEDKACVEKYIPTTIDSTARAKQ